MAGNAGKVWVADQYDKVSISLSLCALHGRVRMRRAPRVQRATGPQALGPVDPPPVYPLITSPPLGCKTCPVM